jgi:hypothetical protein
MRLADNQKMPMTEVAVGDQTIRYDPEATARDLRTAEKWLGGGLRLRGMWESGDATRSGVSGGV